MARRIEREVRKNRRKAQRLESTYRVPSPDQTTTLSVPELRVSLEWTITVYTRPLEDALIPGHPDPAHHPGQGVCGDRRGSWSQVDQSTESATLDAGRAALAEALSGVQRGIDQAAIGSGTTTPNGGDTSLEAEDSRRTAWYDRRDASSTAWLADYRFDAFEEINEAGLTLENGDFAARLTTSGVSPDDSTEAKIEVEMTVNPDTGDNVALTDGTAISDALATEQEAVGLDQIALGTDSTQPGQSDTSLGTEVIRKPVDHDVAQQSVTPWTIVIRQEPSTQPHDLTELAVLDGDGTMSWRVTFSAETKDSRTRLQPRARLRIL